MDVQTYLLETADEADGQHEAAEEHAAQPDG